MSQDIEERILRLQAEIQILSSLQNIQKRSRETFKPDVNVSCESETDNLVRKYQITEHQCTGVNTGSNDPVTSETEKCISEICYRPVVDYEQIVQRPCPHRKKRRSKTGSKCKSKSNISIKRTISSKRIISQYRLKKEDLQVAEDINSVRPKCSGICCACKKQIDKLMSNAKHQIHSLRAQIDCSNSNLELLSAGREFLSETLKILKIKHLELKQAFLRMSNENDTLRAENMELQTNLPEYKKFCDEAKECRCLLKRLQNQNTELRKQLCEAAEAKGEAFKAVQKQNKEILLLRTENDTLRQQVHADRTLCLCYVNKTENKIRDLITLEEKSQYEIKLLKGKVKSLKENKISKAATMGRELYCLRIECSTLKKRIVHIKNDDRTKMKSIEDELVRFQNVLTRKERIVTGERREILQLIDDLSEMVCLHRKRIDRLLCMNKQLEKLLFTQNELLKRKEKDIQLAEEATETALQQTIGLQKMIESLESTLSISKFFSAVSIPPAETETRPCNALEFIQNDLLVTKTTLEDEKQKLAIKDKIIQDQADTIRSLKCNRSCNCLKSQPNLPRMLEDLKERRNIKNELLNEIHELESERNRLIRELVDVRSRDDSEQINSQITEQYEILSTLEDQVRLKQEEWRKQYASLLNEKTQAIEIARFATQKLVETMAEFQRQARAQREAHAKVEDIINKTLSCSFDDCSCKCVQMLYSPINNCSQNRSSLLTSALYKTPSEETFDDSLTEVPDVRNNRSVLFHDSSKMTY